MKVQWPRVMGLLLLLIVSMFAQSGEAQMVSFLINCGTNSSVNVDGRRWVGDTALGSNVTLSVPGVEASTTIFDGDPIYEPLYKIARVFTNTLNYTFRVIQGNYFLRLHFQPLAFHKYNANDSYFAAEVNGLKLVSEFNVPGEISSKNRNLQGSGGNSSYFCLVKQYFFSVDASVIVVSFVPSKGSFGFVNAIEIVPEGNKMFVELVRGVGANGGNSNLFELEQPRN